MAVQWLNTIGFASLSEMERQVANRLLCAFASGRKQPWHGHCLEVRTVEGKGGKSGLQYQVKVSSLPPELQGRLNDLQSGFEGASNPPLGTQAQQERTWKYDVIRPALAFPKNSKERGQEVAKLDGKRVLNWKSKYQLLSSSTLYRWIDAYEVGGLVALSRKVHENKGKKICWVSLAWHNAVPFDDRVKAAIHEDLKGHVRGLIMKGSQRKQTRVLASEKLKELSAAHGFKLNDPAREKTIFQIPHDFVQDEQHYKEVYRRRSDRKAYEDSKPRIRRTIEGLMPMDVVVADVHHGNVRILREDGSTATAKMIAFFDVATERFFYDFILFEGRGGVRNIDVIRCFVEMCRNPAFGLPKKLYFDNGSEYRFADYLEDALKLRDFGFGGFGDLDSEKNVHRAKPYNAAAKRIEGGFRELNQYVQRHISGWIDDDRMKPKGRELGKAHRPYASGFEAFCEEFRALMLSYDNMPKSGALGGKSPNERFAEFVDKGWRATVLDPQDLLTVFAKVETRVVRNHGIDADGRTWSCDGLLRYFGKKVQVHIPLYGFGFNMLKVCDLHGREIGIAEPDRKYSYFDPRGAHESARRTSIRDKALTALSKTAPEIDVKAELIAYGERHGTVIPNEPDGVVSVNGGGATGKHMIMPEMTKKKTRAQIEEEVRKQDEARTLFIQIATAGSAR